jgi:pimeloyl-ACP methyl ester carboxylesterase
VDAPADIAFVHAVGGRAGVDAWPLQADVPGARFLVRRGFGDDELLPTYTVDGEADWLAAQVTGGTVLVGHSWSAVAVLATAVRVPELRGVVVVEPAATSVAPDHPDVREHVRAMSPAFEDGLPPEEFGRRFSAGMGFELPAPTTARDERALELLRRHRPPWETALTAAALRDLRVPLAVVTGSWSPLYEAIGGAVTGLAGGVHLRLEGAGHRPQDLPRFTAELLDLVGRLPPTGP